MKETTKVCPECGCDRMVEIRSQDLKICPDCKKEVDWYVEEGETLIA